MASLHSSIQISPLGKRHAAALRAYAKSLGLSAEDYAKQLIEDGIRLQERARTESFDQLYAPVHARFRTSGMTEGNLDQLVDGARRRHHRRTTRKKA